MKRIITFLAGKAGFVAAIAVAAVVGGVSAGIAVASIPASNGTINACYRTNGGDLRVRDTAIPADACSNKETPISWNTSGGGGGAGGNTAYGHIERNGVLDTSRSSGIVSSFQSTVSAGYVCIQTASVPKNVQFTSEGITHGTEAAVIRGTTQDGINGSSLVQQYCGSDANIIVSVFEEDGITSPFYISAIL